MTAVVGTPAAGAPITGAERGDVLDVMRGLAVFGMLLVNVDSFTGCGFAPPHGAAAGARFNGLAALPVEFLVQGKLQTKEKRN